MNVRNCPNCNKTLEYKSKDALNLANQKNTFCKSCSTKNQYIKNPLKNKGVNNGRTGFSLIEILNNKYGELEAKTKYNEWSKKLSLHGFKNGILNPAYNKMPPLNSGKSYKGWYKNLFFRSTLELMFILDYESLNKSLPLSADNSDLRIKYIFESKDRTYVPDFYCPINKIIYELKCSRFIDEPINIAKFAAANNIYSTKNFTFKVKSELDINNFIGFDNFIPKLKNLNDKKIITLTDKSILKLNNRLK